MESQVNDLIQEGLALLRQGPSEGCMSPELFFGAARRLIEHFGSVTAPSLDRQLQFLLHECDETPTLRARLAVCWGLQRIPHKKYQTRAA